MTSPRPASSRPPPTRPWPRSCTWTRRPPPRLADRLQGADFSVKSVERKPYRRSPYAPFRTTTLQQEASRKLGFSAKYTMSVAQRLYENGHITYMRTDSVTLSQTAINAARNQARELYGAEYVSGAPRVYSSKVKNAQEAHEAIRPAGDTFRTPASRADCLVDELRLYELVWKRTVASPDEGRHRRVGLGPSLRPVKRRRSRPSSAPPARSSPSTASSRRTSRTWTRPTAPTGTTGSGGCRRWPSPTR